MPQLEQEVAKTPSALKLVRYHLCDSIGGRFVVLETRARYGWIVGAQERRVKTNPYCFIVSENVVVDPEAWDLGTIYWYDENGGRLDWIEGL